MTDWRETWKDLQRAGTPACPQDEELSALVLGQLAAESRDRLADHVVSCRDCTARVRDLMELHRETGDELTRPGAPATRRPARTWRLPAAAAAVIVLGGVAGITFWRGTSSPPLPTADRTVEAGAEDTAAVPGDGATLAYPPTELRWRAREDADRYRVALYDLESTLLWESPWLAEVSVSLPETVRGTLVPGATYYWRVFYLVGVDRRQSVLYRFSLEP